MMRRTLAIVCAGTLSCSGGQDGHKKEQPVVLQLGDEAGLEGNERSQSSNAGNLVATAIQTAHKLDVVFYPAALLDSESSALLDRSLPDDLGLERVLSLYPEGPRDSFLVGTMSGRAIREFITQRIGERFLAELEVAGVEYDFRFVGGVPSLANIKRQGGGELKEDETYRVAMSEFFYFSDYSFPGYKYRNGMASGLRRENRVLSARESVRSYLAGIGKLPSLVERRAQVRTFTRGDAGEQPIYRIQGKQHLSPMHGMHVKTSGIVTKVGMDDWYPGGIDLVLQHPEGDADPETSDGVLVHLPYGTIEFQVGDEVSVQGVVYEVMTGSGLSQTAIREVEAIERLKRASPLPPPVILGRGGRTVPTRRISTYRGDLNTKPALNLRDGIDFWESLEWMQVQTEDLRVLGFRGGNTKMEDLEPKNYLNLYVTPELFLNPDDQTQIGGLLLGPEQQDYNPEILMMPTHHLSSGIQKTFQATIGDRIEGRVTGVIGYVKNLFGDGEYAFLPSAKGDAFHGQGRQSLVPLDERPVTKLVSSAANELTVATFNVENLPANQPNRILSLVEAIEGNLKCPDILNLVEIQDSNGQDFSGNPQASRTMDALVKQLKCGEVRYKALNIDPFTHTEGGQPGGNIRVSLLYNTRRLEFEARGAASPLSETVVQKDGSLNINPGRVFPNDEAFEGSRKSIVAQFKFAGKKVTVIGNHFNSKLGDTSQWGNVQPAFIGSNRRRTLMADRINDFVEIIMKQDAEAQVLVLGDFNAYFVENPMRVLEGEHLRNLISYGDLVPANERYTTNYNGSSQALDYIFVNHNLLQRKPQLEILHINSDYMGRLSDHDPVIAKFSF